MSQEVMTYIITILVGIFGSLLALIGKFLLDAIKDHLAATKANTLELALVKQEIKNILRNSDQIPELQKDLNNFFARVKALEISIGGSNGK